MRKKLLFTFLAIVFVCLITAGGSVYSVRLTDAESSYGVIATHLQADDTLQKVFNKKKGTESAATLSFVTQTANLPEDGGPVNEAYRISLSAWGAAASDNAIVFDKPLSVSDVESSGGMTIRLYTHLSAISPFLVKINSLDCAYGIFFYGLGMTGDASDTPVWLPADIEQDEWVDFTINSFDASRLAVDGYVRGITLGMRIDSLKNDDFYVGGHSTGNSYIYIRSISLDKPDKSELDYGEMDLRLGLGSLTHFAGEQRMQNEEHDEELRPIAFKLPVDTLPNATTPEALPQDNGQDVEKAYRFRFHSWEVSTSKHALLFDRPISAEELKASGGLTLRIFADLTTDHVPYKTSAGGIRLYGYGKGIDGRSNVDVLVPADISQGKWTDFHISPDVAAELVGSDGILYGLQYGAKLQSSNGTQFFTGNQSVNAARFYVRSVTINEPGFSTEKTLTYHLWDGESKSVTFTQGLSEYKITPVREGYLFAGWYTDDKFTTLFDFDTEEILEDVEITARWIKLHESPEIFTGIYTTSGNRRIVVYEDGRIDLSDVIAYSDRIGIDEKGILYAFVLDGEYTYDLNILDKKDFYTITYYCFDKNIKHVALPEGEPLEDLAAIDIPGFRFKHWSTEPNGPRYDLERPTGDLTLYACYEYIEQTQPNYEAYVGIWYNPESGDKIVLQSDRGALLADEVAEYRLLTDNGFVLFMGEKVLPGEISDFRILFDQRTYIRLSTSYVTFSLGTDLVHKISTVDGGDFKVDRPEDPVREGMEFVGWKTVDGQMYDFDTVVWRSITLYPVWKRAESTPQHKDEEAADKGCGSAITTSSVLTTAFCGVISAFLLRKRKGDI